MYYLLYLDTYAVYVVYIIIIIIIIIIIRRRIILRLDVPRWLVPSVGILVHSIIGLF
jgi:hypothetical protein